MNTIKGSWVGQTFALAKSNESGGRKTRIRRSKEERKTMVESFIKKYQKLNNGSFPSLSLTQKEVGGSYYTVREIVREIIQENRVLGPAKLTGNDTNVFAEQYPLGSISIEPEIDVESSNETDTVIHGTNQYQSEELTVNSSGEYDELHQLHRQTVADGNIVNKLTANDINMFVQQYPLGSISIESQIDVDSSNETHAVIQGGPNQYQGRSEELTINSSGEYDEIHHETIGDGNNVNKTTEEIYGKEEFVMNINTEICSEGEKDVEETEGLILEAHNQRLENGTIVNGHILETEREELEESMAEVTQMKTEIFVETFPIRPALKTDERETDKVLTDQKDEANIADSISDDDKSDISFECLKSSTAEKSPQVDVSDGIDVDSKGDLSAENQPMNALISGCTENLNGTNARGSHGPSISQETTESNTKPDIQPTKLRDPTLDRINLESWEATSKKSGRTDTNPLFETIKALIVAFVKFWSE